jgi:nucleoside-diphosphate-sugar epimerase
VRIVVIGASGNVGTSVLRALRAEPARGAPPVEVVAVARRLPPEGVDDGATWVRADITTDDLDPILGGADVVIHLAWAIQPSRDETVLRATNIEGSHRVFDAAARGGVGAVVYASSVGAYSAGPKDRAVDETWPTHGIATSTYSRHKAYVERMLDTFCVEHPDIRVVRLRPGLIFKKGAASEIRRLFLGPFVPSPLLRKNLIPAVPDIAGLVFQAVHSLDVGEAYRLAALSDAQGAFNIAADPVLTTRRLAELLDAHPVPVSSSLLRQAAGLTWWLRLQPTPPGWLDLAMGCPVLDTGRARRLLGWSPAHTSTEAVGELLEGLSRDAGEDAPPLGSDAGGRLRQGEIRTGVGKTQGI